MTVQTNVPEAETPKVIEKPNIPTIDVKPIENIPKSVIGEWNLTVTDINAGANENVLKFLKDIPVIGFIDGPWKVDPKDAKYAPKDRFTNALSVTFKDGNSRCWSWQQDGDTFTFGANTWTFTGRITGDRMEGTGKYDYGGTWKWSATRK